MLDVQINPRDTQSAHPFPAVLLAGAVLVLSACASSSPEPREQLAVARAAVEQAGSNAQDAPQLLGTARDKLSRAERAAAQKEFLLARQLADEAAADAEMAQASARSARAKRALEELRLGIQQLRQQINAS